MWLCYVDESGNSGRKLDDPRSPFHTIALVMVPEEHVRPLTLAVEGLVDNACRDESGWPPIDRVELHANELFRRVGPWAGHTFPACNALYRDVLRLLSDYECVVGYATIDKVKLDQRYSYPQSPHVLALLFLLERIHKYINWRSDPLRQRALIVADEAKEHEFPALKLLAQMQRTGSPIGYNVKVDSIIDTIHFVNSRDNLGVQLADLVAYARNQILMKPLPMSGPGIEFMRDLWIEIIRPLVHIRRTWPEAD